MTRIDRFSKRKVLEIYLRCHGFTSNQNLSINDNRITIRLYGKDRSTLTADLSDFILYKSVLNTDKGFYHSESQNLRPPLLLRKRVEVDRIRNKNANSVTESLEVSDVQSIIKNYRMQWDDSSFINGILFLEKEVGLVEGKWSLDKRYKFIDAQKSSRMPTTLNDLINNIRKSPDFKIDFDTYEKILINWTSCREDKEYALLEKFFKLLALDWQKDKDFVYSLWHITEKDLNSNKRLNEAIKYHLDPKSGPEQLKNAAEIIRKNAEDSFLTEENPLNSTEHEAITLMKVVQAWVDFRNNCRPDENDNSLDEIILRGATHKIGLLQYKHRTYTARVEEWLKSLGNNDWCNF